MCNNSSILPFCLNIRESDQIQSFSISLRFNLIGKMKWGYNLKMKLSVITAYTAVVVQYMNKLQVAQETLHFIPKSILITLVPVLVDSTISQFP